MLLFLEYSLGAEVEVVGFFSLFVAKNLHHLF